MTSRVISPDFKLWSLTQARGFQIQWLCSQTRMHHRITKRAFWAPSTLSAQVGQEWLCCTAKESVWISSAEPRDMIHDPSKYPSYTGFILRSLVSWDYFCSYGLWAQTFLAALCAVQYQVGDQEVESSVFGEWSRTQGHEWPHQKGFWQI